VDEALAPVLSVQRTKYLPAGLGLAWATRNEDFTSEYSLKPLPELGYRCGPVTWEPGAKRLETGYVFNSPQPMHQSLFFPQKARLTTMLVSSLHVLWSTPL
jgi:hypothetical protein